MIPFVSVIIPTHNRKELLYKSIKSVQSQSIPVDIIVMDDASIDGTEEMLISGFSNVTYCRSDFQRGVSYQRNEGIKKAKSEIVFFVDDDLLIEDTCTFENILSDFDKPYIGAVTLPFINILQNKEVQQGALSKDQCYLYHSFVGCSFAIRRKVYQDLRGFVEEYFFGGEEGDLSIRMLEAGYWVKAGNSNPAHHFQVPNRVYYNSDFYGRSGDILFYYLNCPKKYLAFSIVRTIFKGVLHGFQVGRVMVMLKGSIAGLKLILRPEIKKLRRPINDSAYSQFRYLKKNNPVTLTGLINKYNGKLKLHGTPLDPINEQVNLIHK